MEDDKWYNMQGEALWQYYILYHHKWSQDV